LALWLFHFRSIDDKLRWDLLPSQSKGLGPLIRVCGFKGLSHETEMG
jgi:hypothetical protein